MSTKLLIASMVGMAIVTRIKNEYIRASIGVPLVAFIMFMLLAMSVSAQWKPDRSDYIKESTGNFSLLTENMSDAIDICTTTLKANGVIVKSNHVDKKDNITPIFIRTQDQNDKGHLLFAYVTKREYGMYAVCFRYILNESGEFNEDFVVLKYESMD